MYTGNDMDTYARNLAELIGSLDLQNVVLIGHSTGVAKSCATPPSTAPAEWRRSSPRGAVPPAMVMSDSNPDGQYRVTHHYTMIGTRQKPVRGREIIFTNLPVDPTAGTEHDR